VSKKFILILKAAFEKRISRKTGWGKNELMREFDAAVTEAVLEVLDKDE